MFECAAVASAQEYRWRGMWEARRGVLVAGSTALFFSRVETVSSVEAATGNNRQPTEVDWPSQVFPGLRSIYCRGRSPRFIHVFDSSLVALHSLLSLRLRYPCLHAPSQQSAVCSHTSRRLQMVYDGHCRPATLSCSSLAHASNRTHVLSVLVSHMRPPREYFPYVFPRTLPTPVCHLPLTQSHTLARSCPQR